MSADNVLQSNQNALLPILNYRYSNFYYCTGVKWIRNLVAYKIENVKLPCRASGWRETTLYAPYDTIYQNLTFIKVVTDLRYFLYSLPIDICNNYFDLKRFWTVTFGKWNAKKVVFKPITVTSHDHWIENVLKSSETFPRNDQDE